MGIRFRGAHMASVVLPAMFMLPFAFAITAGTLGAMPVERHLYVALALTGTTSQVERYRIVDGFPAAHPDLIYPGVTTPMAVGADGSFYATLQPLGSYGESAIQIYPSGSNQPARTIVLPSLSDITYAGALAVAPSGELYVGYSSGISGDAFARPFARGNEDIPGHGIAVYLPQGTGTLPLTAYSFADIFNGPAGLAFGPEGRLYVVGYRESRFGPKYNYVTELAHPWSRPHIVDRLDVANGQATYASSVAFTDPRKMYVLLLVNEQTFVRKVYLDRRTRLSEAVAHHNSRQGRRPVARGLRAPTCSPPSIRGPAKSKNSSLTPKMQRGHRTQHPSYARFQMANKHLESLSVNITARRLVTSRRRGRSRATTCPVRAPRGRNRRAERCSGRHETASQPRRT